MSFLLAIEPEPSPSVSRGYCCVYWNQTIADIAAIEVAPSARRTGIGTALVNSVVSAAIQRNISKIVAQIPKSDSDSAAFFAACGFRKLYDSAGLYDVFSFDQVLTPSAGPRGKGKTR